MASGVMVIGNHLQHKHWKISLLMRFSQIRNAIPLSPLHTILIDFMI